MGIEAPWVGKSPEEWARMHRYYDNYETEEIEEEGDEDYE